MFDERKEKANVFQYDQLNDDGYCGFNHYYLRHLAVGIGKCELPTNPTLTNFNIGVLVVVKTYEVLLCRPKTLHKTRTCMRP